MESTPSSFHSASRSSLFWYLDSLGSLINFDSAVASFELLTYSDRVQSSIMDRSVLLTFNVLQVQDIQLLQAVVTFESGLTAFVSIPVSFREFTSYSFDITASAVSTLRFPNSLAIAIGDTFSLDIRRRPSAADWQQQFTCRFVGDDGPIDLIQSVPAVDRCSFAFDEFPSGSGRIELYSNNVLAWSFAVEFT